MKGIHSILISIAAAALLAGCSGKSGSSAQGTNTVNTATNGFGGYVKGMTEDKKTADKTIDVTSINQELQLFNVQEGRYPKTLQELVPGYMAKIPDAPIGSKLVYDPNAGTVKVVSQ
jgi:ABC-type glycerol-3-phosphate transport system substrate-binding protein